MSTPANAHSCKSHTLETKLLKGLGFDLGNKLCSLNKKNQTDEDSETDDLMVQSFFKYKELQQLRRQNTYIDNPIEPIETVIDRFKNNSLKIIELKEDISSLHNKLKLNNKSKAEMVTEISNENL